MAKKKITRKQLLKGPDEFLTFSGRAANFFTDHPREVRFAGVAVIAIAIIYLAVNTYTGSVNKMGQNAYNVAYNNLLENIKPDTGLENLRKSEELFTAVTDEYGLSRASLLALPQIAHIKFLDKRYDESIEFYGDFMDRVSGRAQYESLARLALAACYEAKGDLKMAIGLLERVVEEFDNPFKEEGMLSLARVYRLDNKLEEATSILKEFVDEYKASPFLPVAEAHLGQLLTGN
ncbi:MAG: tetratricopeptide repeat protein [Thermodesulfobacteriota bacterium]|nr:tetratricopeptide repeat protein [Thermodesulfobacteriota bacterium]